MYESEYASSKHSLQEAPLEATVFDEALLDEMADKLGSYDEARRHLGIKAPEYETPKIEQPANGAFVELGARALAVHEIMESINLHNKTNGAHVTSESPDSDFNRRYEHPEDVLSGLRYNVSRYAQAVEDHLSTLNADKAMKEVGFSPEYVTFTKNRLRDRMKAYEGTGRKNVADRKKEDEKVQHTALRVKNI